MEVDSVNLECSPWNDHCLFVVLHTAFHLTCGKCQTHANYVKVRIDTCIGKAVSDLFNKMSPTVGHIVASKNGLMGSLLCAWALFGRRMELNFSMMCYVIDQ